jgi:hypothetical protein
MTDPRLTRQRLPPDPASSPSMYRITIRPKPGADALQNLQAALRTLRRYAEVIEVRPAEDKPRRQTSVAVKERQRRHKATPYYAVFGNHPRPDG